MTLGHQAFCCPVWAWWQNLQPNLGVLIKKYIRGTCTSEILRLSHIKVPAGTQQMLNRMCPASPGTESDRPNTLPFSSNDASDYTYDNVARKQN